MKIYPTSDKWFEITNHGDEIVVREILKKDRRGIIYKGYTTR